MKWLIRVLVLLFSASEGISLHAQTGGKAFGQCDHDAVITVLRAYEDSLAEPRRLQLFAWTMPGALRIWRSPGRFTRFTAARRCTIR